jgi:hypothetical protein
MKKLILGLSMVVSVIAIHGQGANHDWTIAAGNISDDEGNALAVDASGNVYVTGEFQDTVDFDPGAGTFNLIATAGKDVFIQKLDPKGNLLWAKSIGGFGWDVGQDIAIDNAGNVIVVGQFLGTVDFDPGSAVQNLSGNGTDAFILKLDASGNYIWAKNVGGSSTDYAFGLAIDQADNVYASGRYKSTVDFDPGGGVVNRTAVGAYDLFLLKLDNAGAYQWVYTAGGVGDEIGRTVDVNDDNQVYLSGYYAATVDFDPTSATVNKTSNGDKDLFIVRLTDGGDLVWVHSIGGTSTDYGISLDASLDGYVHLGGKFQQTADFDPGAGTNNMTSNGTYDIFALKLDTAGNFVWSRSVGGSWGDNGNSISVDDMGNAYLIGEFQDVVDFDPGSATQNFQSMGSYDIFILKLDASGNYVFAKTIGGPEFDYGHGIYVNGFGDIHTIGYFRQSVDFDPDAPVVNKTSNGNNDIYVQRYRQCTPSTSTDVIDACDSIIWIDGNTYTSTNFTATHKLVNSEGCDSVITLNLTIGNSEVTDQVIACGAYTWIDGNTYTSSNNTASHTLTNSEGCDSLIHLDLTMATVNATATQSGNTISANASGARYQWLDCDNGFAALANDTFQSFTAATPGNYAVAVTENGCTDTSTCFTISSVGIRTQEAANQIRIFPNPSRGTLHLSGILDEDRVVVYDLLGVIRLDAQGVSSIQLDEGIYIISINGSIFRRAVVQR